jgi:predicted aconitase with swiveling domain
MATVLVGGECQGAVLELSEPLSFWGGVREHDGIIIDVHHPQCGVSVAGRMLVMPGGRGSSSSSSVLAELVRGGHAPAAILLQTPDPILATGALVARELYGVTVAILTLSPQEYVGVSQARHLRIDAGGTIYAEPQDV